MIYQLTIIIPIINESKQLKRLLPQLHQQTQISLDIIVSDGGSTDNSQAVCERDQVRYITAPKGRAKQMNTAVAYARSRYLLFLHADSHLPHHECLTDAFHYFLEQEKYQKSQCLAGHFSLQFMASKPHHRFAYRYLEGKTQTNRPDTINGDQGLLISKPFFFQLGCFDDAMHFLEDQKLSHQIFQQGQWVTLPSTLSTSARRFETEGFYRLLLLMAIIMTAYKTNLSLFFTHSPKIYQAQQSNQSLRLMPYCWLLWKISFRYQSLTNSLFSWYRIGRYITSHSWQCFYFLDQLCQPLYSKQTHSWLKFHDRIIYPLINHALFHSFLGLIAHLLCCWFLLLGFGILEGIQKIKNKLYKKNTI